MKRISILAALLLAACSGVDATDSLAKPAIALTGRVVDQADLLDAGSEKMLTAQLAQAEKDYGPQLVVVTVKTLGGKDIETYSLELANAWKIGHVERDDGLLLLVAPNERKVRIEVGYGLEGSFNDRFAKQIIDETLVPRFKEGGFQQGIVAAVDRMIEKMKAVPTMPVNDNPVATVKDEAA